jgi:glyoxylase-like metal-dependent hydrolase (beta-lactamase superfamily II)
MSVACFLVVHPKGTLMWDVGAVPDNAFKGSGPGTLRYATSTKTLTSQLAEIGYAPGDINYLAISHFHWDHVGNSNLFAPTATWLVRKPERDIMFTEPFSPRTEPQNYSALKNAKTVIVTKDDYDVFGDGTVILKAAPGHSPAHQVLFLKLAKTGPLVISGDLYHYPEERKLKKIPTTEFNADQTVASRATIEAFMQKTHAQLWIQHDFNANAKLKKSPQYYE